MRRFWGFGQSKDVSSKNEAVQTDPSLETPETTEEFVAGSSEDTNAAKAESALADIKSFDVYYAVSLPSAAENVEKELVFIDKKEALTAVKKYEGARFKTFRKEKDALAFASQPAESICATPKADVIQSPVMAEHEKMCGSIGEKPSQFKAPKSQDSVLFRKAIMAGDVQYFNNAAWSNPRYLISPGDTPAILQEGFRYNALHVAAKHKLPDLCQLILNTIEDSNFMQLLYAEDSDMVRSQRISYITDLYLNMPDKRLCETPLHFASKFGCLEAVRILASHPSCDKMRRNKYGLMAHEIICERCPSSSMELKQEIEEAFEGQCFVPVLRALDNSMQPFVGKPCSKVKTDLTPMKSISNGLCDVAASVMAVAGPMSTKQANVFYKNLKTPPFNFSKSKYVQINRIRLCDTEKGLERLGRDLAQNMNTSWIEYWPSLNCWCNLSSHKGLDILEKHLCDLHHKFLAEDQQSASECQVSEKMDRSDCSVAGLNNTSLQATPSFSCSTNESSGSSGITRLCKGLENFHLGDQSPFNSPPTPSSWPRFSSKETGIPHDATKLDLKENTPCSTCVTPQASKDFYHNGAKSNFERSKMYLSSSNIQKYNMCHQSETQHAKVQRFRKTLENPTVRSLIFKPKEDLYFSMADNSPIKEILMRENSQQFQFALKSLIQCLSEMFTAMTLNSDLCGYDEIHELLEDLLPEIRALLKSSKLMGENYSNVHSFVAYHLYKDMCDNFLDHERRMLFRFLGLFLKQFILPDTVDCSETLERQKVLWQHLICVLSLLCSMSSGQGVKLGSCDCSWSVENMEERISSRYENHHFKRQPNICDESPSLSDDIGHDDDDDDEIFCTPPSSLSGDDDRPVTPSEGLEIYIEGKLPSKADLDALRAVENALIDTVSYPHISRWKHLITSKDRAVVENWPSPVQYQRKRNLSMLPLALKYEE